MKSLYELISNLREKTKQAKNSNDIKKEIARRKALYDLINASECWIIKDFVCTRVF